MAIETERLPSPRLIERFFVLRDMKPELFELMSILEVDSRPRFSLKRFERRDRCEL